MAEKPDKLFRNGGKENAEGGLGNDLASGSGAFQGLALLYLSAAMLRARLLGK